MGPSTEHSRCDICSIVKLKRVSCVWRKLAGVSEKKLPGDVPPGHLAVIVGKAGRRFVIKADYLNHPVFRQLLDQAYEEYGQNKVGPLAIPCDEYIFEDIIHSLRGGTNVSQFTSYADDNKLGLSSEKDSRPFLHGFVRRSTCQNNRCSGGHDSNS